MSARAEPEERRYTRIWWALALVPALIYAVLGFESDNYREVLFSLLVSGLLLAPVIVGFWRRRSVRSADRDRTRTKEAVRERRLPPVGGAPGPQP